MRRAGLLASKLAWATYLLLTSLYCLLSFLPYTYQVLIQSPLYPWIPKFRDTHAALSWLAAVAILATLWKIAGRAWRLGLILALTAVSLFLTVSPILPQLGNSPRALWFALVSVWAAAAVAGADVGSSWRTTQVSMARDPKSKQPMLFDYGTAAAIGATIALTYAVGTRVKEYHDTLSVSLRGKDFELAAWSVVLHIVVAIVIVSILDLVRLGAARSTHPERSWRLVVSALIAGGLWLTVQEFLASRLNFEGWRAQLFSVSLAIALTLTAACR